MKRKTFKMLELLGVVSTVLGIFKGMLMDLPFQVWLIIVLGAFTIYWVAREQTLKINEEGQPEEESPTCKKVIINA